MSIDKPRRRVREEAMLSMLDELLHKLENTQFAQEVTQYRDKVEHMRLCIEADDMVHSWLRDPHRGGER